jgi:hypothetical protein
MHRRQEAAGIDFGAFQAKVRNGCERLGKRLVVQAGRVTPSFMVRTFERSVRPG